MNSLFMLSAGAAQGLVLAVEAPFQEQHGLQLRASFGAVIAMQERLATDPCDVLILTEKMMEKAIQSGAVLATSARTLGQVMTGIAVKTGEAAVDVSTPDALAATLRAASGIYVPDQQKSTAGIHFMKVIAELGLETELADRLRPYANGVTALTAMAKSSESGLIGCAQVSEILLIEGVSPTASLPEELAHAAVYTAAVSATAAKPESAALLIEMMTSKAQAKMRKRCGFEPI
jgi:molybdate transport system substrate-binding protein